MLLTATQLSDLEKIANNLDKSGEPDKIKVADAIDEVLKFHEALSKIAIGIIHPKLLMWLEENFPLAMTNGDEAGKAIRALSSGIVVEGVDRLFHNGLIKELQKSVSGVEEEKPRTYEIHEDLSDTRVASKQ